MQENLFQSNRHEWLYLLILDEKSLLATRRVLWFHYVTWLLHEASLLARTEGLTFQIDSFPMFFYLQKAFSEISYSNGSICILGSTGEKFAYYETNFTILSRRIIYLREGRVFLTLRSC